MRYQCMIIIGLLIGENLAVIDGVHNDIYIAYNYQQTLERTSKVQSDLSHFRTLLGECNNLAASTATYRKGHLYWQYALYLMEGYRRCRNENRNIESNWCRSSYLWSWQNGTFKTTIRELVTRLHFENKRPYFIRWHVYWIIWVCKKKHCNYLNYLW